MKCRKRSIRCSTVCSPSTLLSRDRTFTVPLFSSFSPTTENKEIKMPEWVLKEASIKVQHLPRIKLYWASWPLRIFLLSVRPGSVSICTMKPASWSWSQTFLPYSSNAETTGTTSAWRGFNQNGHFPAFGQETVSSERTNTLSYNKRAQTHHRSSP